MAFEQEVELGAPAQNAQGEFSSKRGVGGTDGRPDLGRERHVERVAGVGVFGFDLAEKVEGDFSGGRDAHGDIGSLRTEAFAGSKARTVGKFARGDAVAALELDGIEVAVPLAAAQPDQKLPVHVNNCARCSGHVQIRVRARSGRLAPDVARLAAESGVRAGP